MRGNVEIIRRGCGNRRGQSDVRQIRSRIEEMPKLRADYESVFMEIIDKEDEDDSSTSKTDVGALIGFKNRWLNVLGSLQSFEAQHPPPSNSSVPEQGRSYGDSANIMLPIIKLPQFSGAYKDWLQFYDKFNSLINENKSLSDCQKFHYLKSCLTGDALRTIEALTASNANYAIAWSLLQKRYQNNRLIEQGHVQAIMNVPEITKCTAQNLRELVCDVTVNLSSLRVLDVPVDDSDVFLNFIILSKLDYTTRREFEQIMGTKRPPTAQPLEFLEKKCNMLDAMCQNEKLKSKPTPSTSSVKPFQKYSSGTKTAHHAAIATLACHYCQKSHVINRCNEFLALSVEERRKQAEKRNLCRGCLR